MDKQWFTNKDLYILINELQTDMQQTQLMIRKYNGLYTKLGDVKAKVDQIEIQQETKQSIGSTWRNWSGWAVAIITLTVLLIRFFGGE